jgi:hypothetical protein
LQSGVGFAGRSPTERQGVESTSLGYTYYQHEVVPENTEKF